MAELTSLRDEARRAGLGGLVPGIDAALTSALREGIAVAGDRPEIERFYLTTYAVPSGSLRNTNDGLSSNGVSRLASALT